MQITNDIKDFLENGYKTFLSHITIECVIFTYEDRQLKVLLSCYQDMGWGIPGGHVKHEEPITDAANRILKERTSLDNVFLNQFNTFGDSSYRTKYTKNENVNIIPDDCWFATRTIAVGYYALIDSSKVEAIVSDLSRKYKWVDIHDIPENLGLDYIEIIKNALETLRHNIFSEPIGYELLPEKFTLPEIHALYETILDKKLDRRHFPNKLLSLGIIEKLDEKRSIGQHRSPYLYKFHEDNYQSALNDSVGI
jgi:8-oxo-dGTP diphosphatase